MNEQTKQILKEFFMSQPVHKAYLFGSAARNENQDGSDVDILVELDYANGANYFVFYNMQQQLTRLLNRKVDLVSANGLSSYIRPIIDREKKLFYERE